jgi:Flp pilus assembly protein TadD
MSVATFAVEYEFFGASPGLSHFINILLYALSCIVLFRVLERLLHQYKGSNKWYLGVPFLATVVYLVHPVHTEVVANIKGRDEILSLLGGLLALYYIILYAETGRKLLLVWIFLGFFMGIFSKEIAAVFIVLIPLSFWFFLKPKWKLVFTGMVPVILATIVYFLARHAVLGDQTVKPVPELMNDSFLGMTFGQKYATISSTLGIYLKLLFFPHPLTYDYYPYHIPVTEWSQWQAFVPLMIYVALGIIALVGLRKKSLISFAILFYIITLGPVSNILFPVGAFMNERFVFVGSIASSIILIWFLIYRLPEKFPKLKTLGLGLIVVFVLGFSVKTISRNFAWENDFVLFTTDVKTSVNGAKSNCSAGGKLIEEATKPGNEAVRNDYIKLAIKYLNHALEIHPTYGDALLLLGNAWYELNKNYDSLLIAYKKLLKLNPDHNQVYSNLDLVFKTNTDTDYKIRTYEELLTINPNRFEVFYNLGILYGKEKGDLVKAIPFLKRAVDLKPDNAYALKDLGVAYGMLAKYDSSVIYLGKAIGIDPNDAQNYLNMGISLYNSGKLEEAKPYFQKAKELDPKVVTPQ